MARLVKTKDMSGLVSEASGESLWKPQTGEETHKQAGVTRLKVDSYVLELDVLRRQSDPDPELIQQAPQLFKGL